MYLIDYHTHTTASPDGKNSTLQMCEAAMNAGINEIAITDHFESNGFWQEGFEYDSVHAYSETLTARKVYGDRIKILHGIEIGQAIHNKSAALSLLDKQVFDFVIGSLHNLRSTKDFYFIDYREVTEKEIRQLFDNYLDEVLELADWVHFDVLGHLTYPFQYFAANGIHLKSSEYEEKIRLIYKTLINNGLGIEINFSGLRKKIGETMPDLLAVKLYHELGGEIITMGSDSHSVGEIGIGLKQATEVLTDAGFKYITTFENRKKTMIKL